MKIINSQHLITTKAAARVCPRCRRPVLTGLAEGLPATVTVAPLTPAGEIAALLAGLRTYSLLAGELVHRDALRISGTLPGPVLAEHRCADHRPAGARPSTQTALDLPDITEET